MNDDNVMKFLEKLSDISERLAKVETMLAERNKATVEVLNEIEEHETRIRRLEKDNDRIITFKNLTVWGIATIIALAGVVQWTK